MPDNDGKPLIESDRTPGPPRLWEVVITMNALGGVQIAQHTPSADVTEMLLYRALKFIERELTTARLRREEGPRIRPATTLPPRLLP